MLTQWSGLVVHGCAVVSCGSEESFPASDREKTPRVLRLSGLQDEYAQGRHAVGPHDEPLDVLQRKL